MSSPAQTNLGSYQRRNEIETLDEQWARWCKEHPTGLPTLVDIARELVAAGQQRLSINLIFEVARYRFIIQRAEGAKWALNNNLRSRAARTLDDMEEFAGKFETRALAAQRAH